MIAVYHYLSQRMYNRLNPRDWAEHNSVLSSQAAIYSHNKTRRSKNRRRREFMSCKFNFMFFVTLRHNNALYKIVADGVELSHESN